MKTFISLIVIFSSILNAKSQQPFLLSFEQPEIDLLSDVVQIGNQFYFIQNQLVDLITGSDFTPYSDLLVTSPTGIILEKYNLDGSGAHYKRILKVQNDEIYLLGYLKLDTCLSQLIISKFNIVSHLITHISSYDLCSEKIGNLKIVQGLSEKTFIEGSFSTGNLDKFIFCVDTDYKLSLIFPDLNKSISLSVDFSRKGYVIATSKLYNFYDANFNYRKQIFSDEEVYSLHETHIPFGQNHILEQTRQTNFTDPNPGIQIRVVDSNNLIVRKRVAFAPEGANHSFIELPFFGGISIANKNEIWTSGFFEQNPPEYDTSFYFIAKLDSNLNVICQHFIGYDSHYRIFGIRSFDNGGAIVFGNRVKPGFTQNEGEDIYAIRVGENCELPATVSTNNPREPLLSISAYPNPGLNDLTFSVNGFDPSVLQVELIDESGHLLFATKDLTNSIQVPELPVGQYFYRILKGEKLMGIGSWVKQ